MFKRFTDCQKWLDPWYRTLPLEYKLLWNFICDHCDNAGVWKIDFEVAAFFIGAPVEPVKSLEYYGHRIHVLSPAHWLISQFVDFQFGLLSSESPLHRSVLKLIEKYRVSLPYPKPRPRLQVKEKVKDVKTLTSGRDAREGDDLPADAFETIWLRYPRRIGKKAAERHFKASVREIKDWLGVQNALECFLRQMRNEARPIEKIPYGSTWFNNWYDWINYTEDKMHPMAARAILNLMLLPEQIEKLRNYEKKNLPEGRCLQGFEICRMFRLKAKPLSEEQTDEMERLWFAFERNFLWPQQRRENALHPEGCTMFTCRHPPAQGVRSKLEEIYQWEDFSRMNFGTNVEDVQWA